MKDTYPKENKDCDRSNEVCVSTKGLFLQRSAVIYTTFRAIKDYFQIIDQTTAKIEGTVTKYATKITFKEGENIASTYIKIGTNGAFFCNSYKN